MLIKLSKNQSHFPIEKLKGKEQNLTHLEIQAPFLSQTLDFLPNFPKLKNLSFINCQELSLVADLSMLTELKVLKFKNVHTAFEDLIICSNAIEHLQITGCQLKQAPQWIYQCHQLQELILSDNAIELLEDKFIHLKTLTRLNLENNKLTNLPDSLFTGTRLSHLNVEQNFLNDECKQQVFENYKIWLF